MMPRHGDLDQVVMNEYSALLLLSSISLNSRTYLGHMILCFLCCFPTPDDPRSVHKAS